MRTYAILAAALASLWAVACVPDDGLRMAENAVLVAGKVDITKLDPITIGGPVVHATVLHQGMALNGVNLNGIHANGINLNGIHANSIWMSSLSFAGVRVGGQTMTSARVDKGELVAERWTQMTSPLTNKPMLKKQTLRGKALIGAELTGTVTDTDGNSVTLRYRVVDVKDVRELAGTGISGEWHPLHFQTSGTSFVYHVQVEVAREDGSAFWMDACNPADGEGAVAQWAFPIAAVWDGTGARSTPAGQFTLGCLSGAIGKCYKWGYRPWVEGLAAQHQGCTRMARADYCGNGQPHTENGTAIDVSDWSWAGQIHESAAPAGFTLEAWWGENGATCVYRGRLTGLPLSASVIEDMCEGSPTYAQACEDQWVSTWLPPLTTRVAAGTPFHPTPVAGPRILSH